MATAQKRGFRLPWGGDSHRDDATPDDSQASAAAADAADSGSATVEGSEDGPFGPASGLMTQTARGSSRAAVDRVELAWPDSDRKTVGPLAALGRRTAPAPEAMPEDEAERGEAMAVAPDVATSTDEVERTDAQDDAAMAVTDEATYTEVDATLDTGSPNADDAAPDADTVVDEARAEQPVPVAEPPEAGSAEAEEWPHDEPASEPTIATTAPTGGARRDNPLVAGLVRAMRDAARTARDEAIATLHGNAATAGETLKAHAAEAAAELRKAADADIASIKEWSRTELARVRAETESRIAARKDQLTWETEADAQATEERVANLTRMVEAFESEMAEFFEVLLAEEDPARLAGLAEQMPAAPEFDDLVASDALDATVDADDDATPSDETVEPPDGLLDADAAAEAEEEARAGLDHQTNLVVNGLSDVAAIAAFKGALMTVDGVSAINVSAGDSGQVLFAVTHGGTTELRDALQALESYEVEVAADDGATLSLEVRERDA